MIFIEVGRIDASLIRSLILTLACSTKHMDRIDILIYLGDLQERLESFGSVRLEWPNTDHTSIHRNSSNSRQNACMIIMMIMINMTIRCAV
jgi:hypothetical protein